MYIGLGIFLLVLGAILYFAVSATVAGVSLGMIGIILMVGGLLAIVLSFLVRGRTARGYSATRQSTVDPATGTRVERTDVDPG